MARLLRFLTALLVVLAAPALAQTFPRPPDVAAYVPWTPQYKTDGTANYPVDSTVTPMPIGSGLTNIPIPSTTNRLVSNGPYDGTVSPYCKTVSFGGTCLENKFRTIIDFGYMLPDDPERNYAQSGASHLHCFFGAGSANAWSTFKTLRKHALNSTAAGTDANGTAYWYPCIVLINPFGDGKNYALRADWITVYYTENPATDGTGYGLKAHTPTGLRYVFGFEMDAASVATQYAWLQTVLDAANTASGHTRYSLRDPSGHLSTQGFYSCIGATPVTVYVLKNADGSDPYAGTCESAAFTGSISGSVLTVSSVASGTIKNGMVLSSSAITGQFVTITSFGTGTGGTGTYNLSASLTVSSQALRAYQDFFINMSGPKCYDGTNLWAPGSYKHVIPSVWDADNSRFVCPYNGYQIPNLSQEIHFTQYGWADRQRWDLSSDIAYRAAHGLTTTSLPPGTTIHEDWFDGWDRVVRLEWETNCNGVEHSTGHECNTSQINDHQYLKGGNPGESGAGGRTPQVDVASLPHINATDPGWMLIPPAWSGSLTNMHVHH